MLIIRLLALLALLTSCVGFYGIMANPYPAVEGLVYGVVFAVSVGIFFYLHNLRTDELVKRIRRKRLSVLRSVR